MSDGFYSLLIIDNHATMSIFILKAWIGRSRSQYSKKQEKYAKFSSSRGRERDSFFHNKELNIICCCLLEVKTKPYQPLLMYLCRIY